MTEIKDGHKIYLFVRGGGGPIENNLSFLKFYNSIFFPFPVPPPPPPPPHYDVTANIDDFFFFLNFNSIWTPVEFLYE